MSLNPIIICHIYSVMCRFLPNFCNDNIFGSVLIENSINKGFDQKSENKKYPAWILQTFAETFADLFV